MGNLWLFIVELLYQIDHVLTELNLDDMFNSKLTCIFEYQPR